MANTFNKYYLDDNGLRALIAKIKANDNQLAALIGLPTDWAGLSDLPENWASTSADPAKYGTVLKKLTDAYTAADNDVKAYIEGLLGYNEPSWPTENDEKLTVYAWLKKLENDIVVISDAAEDAQAAADKGFKSFHVDQNNSLQTITIYANTVETNDLSHEGWKPVGTIDTTDFIVHGMLSDVRQVTLDDNNINLDNGPRYDNGTASDNTDDLLLAENVLMEIFQKTENIVGADISAAKAAGRLPQSYLLMTFGVHPDPNDEGAHEEDKDKEIWVNVSNMVKQYKVASEDSSLFTVSSTEAGDIVTYTITPSQTLRDGVQNSNQIWDLLTSSDDPLIYEENGEWKVRDIPTIPLDSTKVEKIWNETFNL